MLEEPQRTQRAPRELADPKRVRAFDELKNPSGLGA
jgi:hypothetical protein